MRVRRASPLRTVFVPIRRELREMTPEEVAGRTRHYWEADNLTWSLVDFMDLLPSQEPSRPASHEMRPERAQSAVEAPIRKRAHRLPSLLKVR